MGDGPFDADGTDDCLRVNTRPNCARIPILAGLGPQSHVLECACCHLLRDSVSSWTAQVCRLDEPNWALVCFAIISCLDCAVVYNTKSPLRKPITVARLHVS